MIRRFVLAALLLAGASLPLSSLPAKPPTRATGGLVLVRLETSAGPIVVGLETRRAPITTANFLRYVDSKRFDDTSFYRAARAKNRSGFGLVQGGINRRMTRAFLPIAHEPTSQTGLSHVDGTLSMARNAPGTAMGEFFITVGPAAGLDARPGSVGYAAFGHVVSGMSAVRKILAAPTYPGGYSQTTKGQSIIKPIRIITARRVK